MSKSRFTCPMCNNSKQVLEKGKIGNIAFVEREVHEIIKTPTSLSYDTVDKDDFRQVCCGQLTKNEGEFYSDYGVYALCDDCSLAVRLKESRCQYCWEKLNNEEAESPERDESGMIMCDDSYREHYKFDCFSCEEGTDNTEKIKVGSLLAMDEDDLYRYHWNPDDTLFPPGVYEIINSDVYSGGFLHFDSIKLVKKGLTENERIEIDDWGGYYCLECSEKIKEKFSKRKLVMKRAGAFAFDVLFDDSVTGVFECVKNKLDILCKDTLVMQTHTPYWGKLINSNWGYFADVKLTLIEGGLSFSFEFIGFSRMSKDKHILFTIYKDRRYPGTEVKKKKDDLTDKEKEYLQSKEIEYGFQFGLVKLIKTLGYDYGVEFFDIEDELFLKL